MKLKYSQLRDPQFGRAWSKVAAHVGYKSPGVAINIAKVNKAFIDESKMADDGFHNLALQYAELDEKGEIKAPDNAPKGSFKISEEKKDAWQKALDEFNEIEFEFQGKKLKVEDVLPAGLSPLDLTFLDPLLEPFLEAVT